MYGIFYSILIIMIKRKVRNFNNLYNGIYLGVYIKFRFIN